MAAVLALSMIAIALQATGSQVASSAPDKAAQCGFWRWPVKTLSDKAASKVDYSPLRRKVTGLRTLKAPGDPMTWGPNKGRTRGVERRTYKIHVVLVRAVLSSDHDIRLIVGAATHPKKTMALEFADPACNGAAASKHRAAMAKARTAFLAACPSIPKKNYVSLSGVADIKGVGLWDTNGSGGGAPNGLELHPVLKFNGTCSKA